MRTIVLLHIVAGGLGLLTGYLALAASKGATVHRKSGLVFVVVMLTMAVTGMLISAVNGVAPAINVPSAVLTGYLVITSLMTVRPIDTRARRAEVMAMLFAAGIGLSCLALGIGAIARGGPAAGAAFPLFLFGGVALLASAGDRRVARFGTLRGRPRLVRHLWRMCFALFIASIAFYGAPGRLPDVVRTPALIATGVLLPLAATCYWLWRLRGKRTFRAVVGVPTSPATAELTPSR